MQPVAVPVYSDIASETSNGSAEAKGESSLMMDPDPFRVFPEQIPHVHPLKAVDPETNDPAAASVASGTAGVAGDAGDALNPARVESETVVELESARRSRKHGPPPAANEALQEVPPGLPLSVPRNAGAWWQNAVGYQVYLPSFRDSDGDGWGDLPGVTSELDHLVSLGVDVLWLTPFFVSPMHDHGYDIADYMRVDDCFGGDEALDELVRKAHGRGLRVMADLVVNHTSEQHPWFLASQRDPAGAYGDYYIWRDPASDDGPPNNWLSHFGGPAWTYDEVRGQYYLHLFAPEQPDLNWRLPAVADEVDAILEHWLSRGIDGFRIDTAGYMVKHLDLLDNPLLPEGEIHPVTGVTDDWRQQDHLYDIHQEEVHGIHERWRQIADRYGAFLVGEVYELDPDALAVFITDERLHSSFWFGLIEDDWHPQRISTMVRAAATASPRLSWVLGNHDRPRAASRYGGGELGRRRVLALHTVMAFLPGTFWIYQGDELALSSGVVPPEQAADLLALDQPDRSRDAARTPMPWHPKPGLGFTTGTPWLPEGGREPDDTVAAQTLDPASPLARTRNLIQVRREVLAANSGSVCLWPDEAHGNGDVLIYRRGNLTVAANLTDVEAALPPLVGNVVYDTEEPDTTRAVPASPPTRLHPQQALVIELVTGDSLSDNSVVLVEFGNH